MPTVRIPQNDVRMLNMGGLEQAQQSFGNAVQEDSASLYNQQVKTALQQNMVAVNQAKQQYIEQMNNNAYDPDLGLLNMNGTEAVGVTSAMNQFSKSSAQNIINSNLIGNNNVRKQAFLEEIGPIADSYNKMAMDHEYKQTQIADFLNERSKQFEQLINRATSLISYLQERRTALISAAVTGKIDLRGWQPPQSETQA